jgi:uncharacterized protein (TIGR00725 family)
MAIHEIVNGNICHTTFKYKICVSGSAEIDGFGDAALQHGEAVGREIVKHDAVLIDGATTGFPFYAAKGAKAEGGVVVGFSPAATEHEHIVTYQLPTEHHDLIVYTGFNYSGRNLLLVRASDAVIFGPGRMGTLNEFTITFEDKKPIGILEGPWDTDETIRLIIKRSHRAPEMKGKIVIASDPKALLDALVKVIDAEKKKNYTRTL